MEQAEQAKWLKNVRDAATTRERLDSVLSARVFDLRSKTEENVFRKSE
jgi:hypothetical protein